MIFMIRRSLTVIVFIALYQYGYFQTMTITIFAFYNLVILLALKPFSKQKTNKVEFANEFIVYLCCMIKICFLNVAYAIEVRNELAKVMIIFCIFNVS